jgi:membrane protein
VKIKFVFELAHSSLSRFQAHSGSVLAGYIAYTTLLAIFPFVIFSVSLTGLLIGEDRSAEAVQALFDVAPEHIALTLEPVVREVLSRSYSLFTLFVVVAVWVAMSAVDAISTAFDRAYGDVPQRVWLRRKAKSLVTVMVASLVAVIMGLLILLAPVLLAMAQKYTPFEWTTRIDVTRYLIGMFVFYSFLWGLHRFLPNSHAAGFSLWPGVLISTFLWIAMASGLSVYLSNVASYTITYGTLSGVVITLLFLYLSGAIIILGAEVNAALKTLTGGR